MIPDTKLYRAYTMAEALAAVKRDLGSDAVILRTRTLRRRRILGLGRRQIIEVTARSAPPVPVPVPVRAPRMAQPSPVAAPAPASPDFERTRRLARALLEKHEQEYPALDGPPVAQTPSWSAPPADGVAAASDADDVARRYILTPAPAARPARHTAAVPGAREPAPTAVEVKSMQDELTAIRDMVGRVLESSVRRSPAPRMPQAMFEIYLRLVGQELEESVADAIIDAVRDTLTAEAASCEQTVRSAVRARLAERIAVADETAGGASPDGRPLTIALVGPTGVGKTTTVAKLAASFKVRRGRRVGLVTSDTYRIAAVEQLRTYANIIGLPLQVVLTAGEMRQAIHALSDCDVVLIDTAGRSQNDARRIAELRAFVDSAEPHEVHLVLSSTAGPRVLEQESEAFAEVGAERLLFTKLDEAVTFGAIANIGRRTGMPLSYLTTGQEVPDHIEAARAERLAALILGEPVAHQVGCGA